MDSFIVETRHGPACVGLSAPEAGRGFLVLGPGASGQTGSADLALARSVAGSLGMAAAVVQSPHAVAGRRVPPRGSSTDEAFADVVAVLRERFPDGPLVTGGRSFGARVACRTVESTGADAVLCLAFPLQPPGDRPSRQLELTPVEVPCLIVQGRRDVFGVPTVPPAGELLVDGDHSLQKDHAAIRGALTGWLTQRLAS